MSEPGRPAPPLPVAGETILDAAQRLQSSARGLCSHEARRRCRADCCHAEEVRQGRVVGVNLPDLIALATYLYRPTDRASLRAAVAGILREHCTLSPVTATYMLSRPDGRCPFLGQGDACTVYTVRPLLCRLYFHCKWIGERPHWNTDLDNLVMGAVLDLALDLGRYWEGHAGIVWRRPWRYDALPL